MCQENSFSTRCFNKFLSGVVFSYRNLFLPFNPSTLGFFPHKSVISLLSRRAPKCQFSLSFTPTCIFLLSDASWRCQNIFFFFNLAFENLSFPLYLLLFYPFYHHPFQLPSIAKCFISGQIFLKLHLLLLLLLLLLLCASMLG